MSIKLNDPLVVKNDPRSTAAEAFRALRTNIQFMDPDQALKSIVITSACPGEGKTTLVANLAISMAQLGKKVVCVDTDLRKPELHNLFNTLNMKGLTDYLMGIHSLGDVLQSTGIEGLSLITSGPKPPNPSEVLSSQKMKALMKQLSFEYDLVIYDSPPVISVTDAVILSSQTDGVILLIDSRASARQAVVKAKQTLELANAKILGVVLGKVSKENRGYYYYYYGGQ